MIKCENVFRWDRHKEIIGFILIYQQSRIKKYQYKIDKMKKDFTTAINNSNKINPPMYLIPEDYEIDGKKIIYIRVPEGTQVRRLNGRIFDRTYEGDLTLRIMLN